MEIEPCGCSLMDGRCADHAYKMRTIHSVWVDRDASDAQLDAIWSASDGYGVPGLVPPQGYDWSGIRDSSSAAVEAMYVEATR